MNKQTIQRTTTQKKSRKATAEKLPFRVPMQDNRLPFVCPKCGVAANMRFDAPFLSDPSWVGWGVAPNRWLCCQLDEVVHWCAVIGRTVQHGLCWDHQKASN